MEYHVLYRTNPSSMNSSLEKDKSSTSSNNDTDNNTCDPKQTIVPNQGNSSEESNKEVNGKFKTKHRKEKLRLELNQIPEYLSRSEEQLSQKPVTHKRNISDVQLSKRSMQDSPSSCEEVQECTYRIFESTQKDQDTASENGKNIITKFKSTHTCTTPTTETDSDDVEARRSKRVNLGRVVSQSIRGSIKLVRRMRPKSDSEVGTKEPSTREQFRRFRELATTLLVNAQQLSVQPPAPLVVEDPPSTDEELNDIRNQNPALLNGSSGNFGSAGPRSAPSTPQGQLGAPQGLTEPLASPTIQRSPSHSVFTKADKTNLKLLSSSTPAMTAQGQLAEPPSPKATKDPKVHTTSKARQKKFLRHFPNVEEDEKVLNHYSCALIGDILLQGHLYITKNYFAFYSNVFGYVTKLLIPILTVEEITKEKTARIIPNAVGITTSEDKHIFGSLMSRDSTLAYMKTVWEKAKSEEALPEPEITEPDQDSSESGESGRESPSPEPAVPSGTDVLASAKFDRIKKETTRSQSEGSLLERKGSKGFITTLKDAITEFRKLPRQSLILVATTLLLILLFLSAAVLLYRINRIQNKYSITLQGATLTSASNDIYGDLLQWQTHLHSKAADAVNNILDTNLDQIAKVRQSLEALSTLLVHNQSPSLDNNATPLSTEDAETKAEPASISAENQDS